MNFGNRLKKLREAAGKSGEDVAFDMRKKNVVISTATYYNWEKNVGAPDVNQLNALASALGVSSEDLI